MSIENAVVLVGGTTSTTGGTSTSFISKGDSPNVTNLVLDDGADYLSRTSVKFTSKDPVKSNGAPNGMTQQRSEIKVVRGFPLDNGSHTTNTCGAYLSCDPEATDAEKAALMEALCQLIIQAANEAFWKDQAHG
jgi:hypothetical protein